MLDRREGGRFPDPTAKKDGDEDGEDQRQAEQKGHNQRDDSDDDPDADQTWGFLSVSRCGLEGSRREDARQQVRRQGALDPLNGADIDELWLYRRRRRQGRPFRAG